MTTEVNAAFLYDRDAYKMDQRLAAASTHRGTIYLGGPMSGHTYDAARYGWRAQFAKAMPPGITCLSPMRQEGHFKKTGIIDDVSQPEKHKFIFQKDVFDIRRADLVVFNFLEAWGISKGSLVELGMAYAYGKTILVAAQRDNVHQHIFLREAAVVFENFDDLIGATKGLLSEGI